MMRSKSFLFVEDISEYYDFEKQLKKRKQDGNEILVDRRGEILNSYRNNSQQYFYNENNNNNQEFSNDTYLIKQQDDQDQIKDQLSYVDSLYELNFGVKKLNEIEQTKSPSFLKKKKQQFLSNQISFSDSNNKMINEGDSNNKQSTNIKKDYFYLINSQQNNNETLPYDQFNNLNINTNNTIVMSINKKEQNNSLILQDNYRIRSVLVSNIQPLNSQQNCEENSDSSSNESYSSSSDSETSNNGSQQQLEYQQIFDQQLVIPTQCRIKPLPIDRKIRKKQINLHPKSQNLYQNKVMNNQINESHNNMFRILQNKIINQINDKCYYSSTQNKNSLIIGQEIKQRKNQEEDNKQNRSKNLRCSSIKQEKIKYVIHQSIIHKN